MKLRYDGFRRCGLLGVAFALTACIGGENGKNEATQTGRISGSGGSNASGGTASTTDGANATGGKVGSRVDFAELNGATLGTELSATEVMALCSEIDSRTGLINNIEAACQLEGWISSPTESSCLDINRLCLDGGYTLQGLELPLTCSSQPRVLTECELTVSELVACADEEATFVAARTCDEARLFDPPPDCMIDVSANCPSLYASGSIPSTGGSLGTGGILGTGGSLGSTSGTCSGVTSSCYSMYSSYACSTHPGCYWSSSSDSCSGVAYSCYSMYSSYSCNALQGCYWSNN